MLEDLTSYNGVFVNGLRVTHTQDLAHGDLVQIGDYRIVLQDEAVRASAAADGRRRRLEADDPAAPPMRARRRRCSTGRTAS